ncbi:unnamed protein product [Cladocopium goreaui]|uniref:Uncharacterized protein n=1 Tax=Cladocopium goreaui TaxID=2562237 RepID=A0A9P1CNA2_9DINO|nr:unnamed protein product [Cladocopium goreaui]
MRAGYFFFDAFIFFFDTCLCRRRSRSFQHAAPLFSRYSPAASFSTAQFKVCINGGAGSIGQPLTMLMAMNESLKEVSSHMEWPTMMKANSSTTRPRKRPTPGLSVEPMQKGSSSSCLKIGPKIPPERQILDVNCAAGETSWKEHLFVLLWQRDEISAFVDPTLSYNQAGQLISIQEKLRHGSATFKTYKRPTTPTWSAVQDYMNKCFPGRHAADAPFDIPMKIVLNIAVGGYGGAPCFWGEKTCADSCGAAVGSELIISDISVWQ